MYIVIRKYSTASPSEVMQKIQEGFVPLVSNMPGFINYYAFTSKEDEIVIVNMFDSEINGQNSNDLAAKWVDENIAHLYSGGPVIFQGEACVAQAL